jgi:hypothetical protein
VQLILSCSGNCQAEISFRAQLISITDTSHSEIYAAIDWCFFSEAVSYKALFSVESNNKVIMYDEMKVTKKGTIRELLGIILVFTWAKREE